MYFHFVETVGSDLSAYNAEEAWPSLIDDFVDWKNTQQLVSNSRRTSTDTTKSNPPLITVTATQQNHLNCATTIASERNNGNNTNDLYKDNHLNCTNSTSSNLPSADATSNNPGRLNNSMGPNEGLSASEVGFASIHIIHRDDEAPCSDSVLHENLDPDRSMPHWDSSAKQDDTSVDGGSINIKHSVNNSFNEDNTRTTDFSCGKPELNNKVSNSAYQLSVENSTALHNGKISLDSNNPPIQRNLQAYLTGVSANKISLTAVYTSNGQVTTTKTTDTDY